MLSLSFAIWGTVSLAMPSSADRLWATMLMRVLVGIAQGFLIPSIHTVLSLVNSSCLRPGSPPEAGFGCFAFQPMATRTL